eukprot:GHVT01043748.1.p1 GENE.GHVT01043748.1~~GHVT01043748.1.p1  ORF type:complete len:221 (+),score=21.61 GHVT01043748.1:863-1525(+)
MKTCHLEDRTVLVPKYIDRDVANELIASVLFLRSRNSELPITILFGCTGASSEVSLCVYDALQGSECPLSTVNLGLASSGVVLLCAAGTPGRRFAMPHARFLLQKFDAIQAVQGFSIGDIAADAVEHLKENTRVAKCLALHSGQTLIKLQRDLRRDFYLSAMEAKAYGLVDHILQPQDSVRSRAAPDAVFGRFSTPGNKYQHLRGPVGWGGEPAANQWVG